MRKEDIIGEAVIGNINDDVLQYIDSKSSKYKPFSITFSSLDSFMKWYKEAKKPLIKSKWLCTINESIPFNIFYRNYKKLLGINKSFIEILYLVSPKGVYSNLKSLETENLPIKRSTEIIIRSFEKMFDDFYGHIDRYEDKKYIFNLIVKKIGYSKKYLELYAPKTLASGDTFSDLVRNIKEFFPQMKITPTEDILFTILSRDKRHIKSYYDACDRYSEKWLNGVFASMLGICIKYQNKIKKGEIDFGDIRNIEEVHKMSRIIRDISVTDLVHLKLLLEEKNISPIEEYFATNMRDKLDGLIENMNLEKKVVRDLSENWRNF